MTLIIEKRLQMVAQRGGLRIIADRPHNRGTGQKRYLLRPASNARRVVQILPDGNYCLASFVEYGRRYIGTRLSLDEVEKFLALCEPMPDGVAEKHNASRRPVSALVTRGSERGVRAMGPGIAAGLDRDSGRSFSLR
jgi:hypothetical protein